MAVAVKQGTIVNKKKRGGYLDFLPLFGEDSRLFFGACCPIFLMEEIYCDEPTPQ
jgi:hypothetical protein